MAEQHRLTRIDTRLEPAPVLLTYEQDLRGLRAVQDLVAGVSVTGSLATGDYQPGRSDLDVLVLLTGHPDARDRAALRMLHRDLLRGDPAAASLHCHYVSMTDLDDGRVRHWRWAFGELYLHPWSAMGRAETMSCSIVLSGPPPVDVLRHMTSAEIRVAARAELSGYWSRATLRRRIWLQDTYVDLGLLTLARVEAVLSEDRLISKGEALSRMHRVGVPADLVEEVRRRRHGEQVRVDRLTRVLRARRVRRLVRGAIPRVLAI